MNDLEPLARLLYVARHESRRRAKRLIRDAGGHGSAEELDRMLAEIAEHPRRAEIEALAETYRRDAERAMVNIIAQKNRNQVEADGLPPAEEWFVCEGAASRRTYVLHLCPAGAESFLCEVIDPEERPPAGVAIPTADGQFLDNWLWLDGEPPDQVRWRSLASEASRQLRIYDAQLEIEEGD